MNNIDFLEEYIAEIKSQDNINGDYPIYVIYQELKKYGCRDFCEHSERKKVSNDKLCQKCLYAKKRKRKLTDFCIHCNIKGFKFFNYEKRMVECGFFLTQGEAERYIVKNRLRNCEVTAYELPNTNLKKLIKILTEIL